MASSIGWILLGLVVYLGYSKEKEKTKQEEEYKTVFEEKIIEERPYKILVAIKNPAVAKKLVTFARLLAKARNGEVILLSVIRLPDQTPLTAGRKYVKEQKEFIEELINLPEVSDIPVGGMLKIAHDIPEAILNAIEEEKADLLILGWRGRTFRRDYILGSTIDPVLFKAPCDVAVIRFEPSLEVGKLRRILIPTAGGPHARLAAELALDLNKVLGSGATLAYFAASEQERERAEKYIQDTADIEMPEGMEVKFEKLIKVSRNKIEALVREGDNFDAIIIGASNQPFLKNLIRGAFPEIIAKKTTKTVIMVRKKIEISEFLRRFKVWKK
ncbi:hypothetical protein DRP07_12060 [Archaeoglobales archaeon]|nr:MAG: hypothetical protein DRP07_12060 [Archaeoglobales archaeon]